MTGRRWIAYVPGVAGAFTWKVNVPVAPGRTVASVCTAGRVVYGQFTDSPAHIVSSRFTPRRASCPSVPLFHDWLPAFRKTIERGPLICPTFSVGNADSETHAL